MKDWKSKEPIQPERYYAVVVGSQHIPEQLYLREVAALMGARVTEDFPEEVSEG